MRVDFYHLTLLPVEKALPRLLEKPYRAGLRVLTLVRDTEEKERLDSTFWSYTTKFFLPHGTDDGITPERQPILLSEKITTVNCPSVIASAGRCVSLQDMPQGCDRMLYMFDGANPTELSEARRYWKECDKAERRYFFQDKQSGWIEKSL